MKKKSVLYAILLIMIISGGSIGFYYWYQGSHYVKTEDSRITGDIYRVMPRIAGKITSLDMDEGDSVVAEQIVGLQDTANLSTNLLDNATLRAPISGTVIKTLAKTGEVVSPGQPVAMIVDKSQLYITANIEETEISRIAVGQQVEFTVDSFPGHTLTGAVAEIGEATASTFSLLPAMNTSGNFTKVTQRIPIKISILDSKDLTLSPGMSTVIKIQVKGN